MGRETRRPAAAAAPSEERRTKRVLNVPLLVATLVAIAVLAPTAYALRASQVLRTADVFLQRASELEAEKNLDGAAAYLHRYLQLHPNDAEVRVRLAKVYGESAADPRRLDRAIDLYYRAAGVAPENELQEVHSNLARLLWRAGRYPAAESEARKALAIDKDDPQASALAALALYGQYHSGTLALAQGGGRARVGAALEKALSLDPGNVQVSLVLAQIYRREEELLPADKSTLTAAERGKAADAIVDAMVKANPNDIEALLARHSYRTSNQLPGAAEDIALALKLAPDDPQTQLLAAEYALREAAKAQRAGDEAAAARLYQESRGHYEKLAKRAPREERVYLGLGNVYLAQGDRNRAVQTWREGLARAEGASVSTRLRLAETLIAAAQWNEAAEAIESLQRAVGQLHSRVSKSEELTYRRAIDLVQATYLVGRGEYGAAVPVLRQLSASPGNSPLEAQQATQAAMMLGRIYLSQGQEDQAAEAFERGATAHPRAAAPLVAAGNAALKAQQPQKAARYFEQALALEDSGETWLSLAAARLHEQLSQPADRRSWGPVREALAKAQASPSLKSPWRATILEAEQAALAGKTDELAAAIASLRRAEIEHAESAELFERLISTYERLNQPADADRAAQRFAELAKPAEKGALRRAGLMVDRKQYDAARKLLRDAIGKLPESAHRPLEFGLAQVSIAEDKPDRAKQEIAALVEKHPSDAALVRQLAELALETRDFAAAQQWEKKLGELQGAASLEYRYFRARRLVGESENTSDPRFQEAEELHAELVNQHGGWAFVHTLGGVIAERKGEVSSAIRAFREAIQRGDRRVAVYEQLILMLYQAQRVEEADRYLAMLRDQSFQSPTLEALEVSVATRRGELDRAVRAAHRMAQSKPKDPLAQVALGNVLQAARQEPEAEKAFRAAIAMAPGDPRAYLALLNLFAQSRQTHRAMALLEQASKESQLPPLQKSLVLAQGYELLQDSAKAELHYREAARLAPDDADIQLRLADHLLASQPAEAEKIARKVLTLSPGNPAAQRVLASVLADNPNDAQWQEAMQLLQRSGLEPGESLANQRLQAMLLMRRGGAANLRKARELFERMLAEPGRAQNGDRILLARIFEAERDFTGAGQQYRLLASQAKREPLHLGLYVDFLLRQQQVEEAASWLAQLESQSPDAAETVGLRARLLAAQGRGDEIEAYVEPLADKMLKKAGDQSGEQASVIQAIGTIYAKGQNPQAAERWFRKLMEVDPAKYEQLATALATNGRMADAMRLCLDAAKRDASTRPALTAATLLLTGKPVPGDFALAEPLFAKAIADHPDDRNLVLMMANLRLVQQRSDESIELYRRVLQADPRNVVAMNNLAALLSEQPGKSQEALEWIDRAIKISGPEPHLLDTKAMAHLHEGNSAEAVKLLQSVATPQGDPRYWFHLAAAYYRQGEREKARAALQSANAGGLANQVLTKEDTALLGELTQSLNENG